MSDEKSDPKVAALALVEQLEQKIAKWRATTIRDGSERWVAAHRKCADDLAARLPALRHALQRTHEETETKN